MIGNIFPETFQKCLCGWKSFTQIRDMLLREIIKNAPQCQINCLHFCLECLCNVLLTFFNLFKYALPQCCPSIALFGVFGLVEPGLQGNRLSLLVQSHKNGSK